MDTKSIIAEIDAEIARLQQARALLSGIGTAAMKAAMVDLIEQCQVACNELIDVSGRAAIQAVLQLSAIAAAGGEPQQGRRRAGDVVFYGRQPGQVFLSDRKLEVERPHLRSKGPRSQEVEVPAYAAMQNPTPMGHGCWTSCCMVFPRATTRL